MNFVSLNYVSLRPKVAEKIEKYLALSNNNCLTVGLYKNGEFYVFGNPEKKAPFL